MSTPISGTVTNGVVVPHSPLPEGALVEGYVQPARSQIPPRGAAGLTASELRKMPREQRQAVLAAAAALAEADYRDDKELTGFDAFSEEERDDNDPDSD